jgi:hypothetical protein
MDRKVVLGVLIGLAVACVCVVVAVIAAGAGFFSWVSREVSLTYDASVTVTAPTRVRSDESFVIAIEIESLSPEPQVLDSVDIDLSYLQGVQIVSSSPPYMNTYSLTPFFEQQSYVFDYSIPGDGQVVVELRAEGLMEGDFSGQIDVCISSGGNCQGYLVRTVVGDQEPL